MIEARTVAFILIILLIAFIVYRLCLSNERKTKGGFDNLNDVVLAVYDSIEKDTKLEDIDIDIATVKYEVLKTLNLVSKESRETLNSAFYDTLNDDEKLAFIEALIHSLYVEGYVPSEFIGCDVDKKQVILEARHNYKYSYITIYLKYLDNEIYDMSKYLNTINDTNKYKISICNSIKAHSVSEYCRWGVYEYVEKDNRITDIDYGELDDLSGMENIRIPDSGIHDLFNSRNNSADISNNSDMSSMYIPADLKVPFDFSSNRENLIDASNNSGLLSMRQSRVSDNSIMRNNSIPIIDNKLVRADENNSIDKSLDKNNSQNLSITPASELTNNETNLVNTDDSNRADESNGNYNNLNNADDIMAVFVNMPNVGEFD